VLLPNSLEENYFVSISACTHNPIIAIDNHYLLGTKYLLADLNYIQSELGLTLLKSTNLQKH